MAVTTQALQDLRAFSMLAQMTSHDYVVSLIDGDGETPVTFSIYPRNNEYLLGLRTRVNEEIVKRMSDFKNSKLCLSWYCQECVKTSILQFAELIR